MEITEVYSEADAKHDSRRHGYGHLMVISMKDGEPDFDNPNEVRIEGWADNYTDNPRHTLVMPNDKAAELITVILSQNPDVFRQVMRAIGNSVFPGKQGIRRSKL